MGWNGGGPSGRIGAVACCCICRGGSDGRGANPPMASVCRPAGGGGGAWRWLYTECCGCAGVELLKCSTAPVCPCAPCMTTSATVGAAGCCYRCCCVRWRRHDPICVTEAGGWVACSRRAGVRERGQQRQRLVTALGEHPSAMTAGRRQHRTRPIHPRGSSPAGRARCTAALHCANAFCACCWLLCVHAEAAPILAQRLADQSVRIGISGAANPKRQSAPKLFPTDSEHHTNDTCANRALTDRRVDGHGSRSAESMTTRALDHCSPVDRERFFDLDLDPQSCKL